MLPISADFIEFVQRAAFAGEDVLRRFGPDEGLRLLVVKQQVVVDRVLEIVDALVAAPADAPVRDLGEEAFDQVHPRGAGGREVQLEPRMLLQPRLHLGRLVGRMVVQHQMHVARLQDGAVDAAQECQELLRPVARHAFADDHARFHIERGEQRGRAVPPVIVGHGGRAPLLQRVRRSVAPVGPRKPTNGWVRSSAWI